MIRPIRRALLSVSDKAGLVGLGQALAAAGAELVATGGTKTALAAAGLTVRDVAELTGFPEILGGRVKTLHPAIYAGVLARRDEPGHLATLAEHGLAEIDLVVCNLYPFEATVAREGVADAEAVEQIDIGGPTMVRAAAKNFAAVAVVTDPAQIPALLTELAERQGTTLETRRALAAEAFAATARYDAAIATYFARPAPGVVPEAPASPFPERLTITVERKQLLRYGENPHQPAAFYVEPGAPGAWGGTVATAEQLHGKELSFNNLLDLDAAWNLAGEFAAPAAVVVKHNNPCGAATGPTLAGAFEAAWAGDPQSAFGGILAFNRPVDAATAEALADGQRFVECVIAPDFDADAFAILTTKPAWRKNVRLVRTGPRQPATAGSFDYRRIDGGLLVQARDAGASPPVAWRQVTQKAASVAEYAALEFAWSVCKHVKSNAIVLAGEVGAAEGRAFAVVGVGAGQMSRVDSTQLALRKAGERSRGAVLASDAFFPFPDNVEAAAAGGVAAIAQPGGSQRDADSVAACDALGVAMYFTGVRHFRH